MKILLKLDNYLDTLSVKAKQFDIILILAILMLLSFALTRGILLCYSVGNFDFNFLNFFGVWLSGFLYDLSFIVYILTPLFLLLALLPSKLCSKKFFFIFRQVVLAGSIFALLFVCIAEILFWHEFQVRFNFISVDYLIYRQEVTENIQQSYPMTLIFASITLLTGLLFWLLKDNLNKVIEHPLNIKKRMVAISVYVLLFFTILTAVDQSTKDVFDNSYQSELASNGPYQFVAAFRNNELAYKKFYTSISDIDAAKIIRKELSIQNEEEGSFDIYRSTKFPKARKKVNVFMVMVESLSSDYLQYFGNEEGITPHLDNLIKDSVFFDKLYATGTRTTRGLEAVTLSIPPTPGRSIVKRLGRETGFCSLGNILNENDYNVNFIYGGRGYFDNINAFFTGNGYGIIDQASTPSEEISFSNAWGMSDEDLFSQAIKSADDSHKKGKLFFSHVMTS